MEWAKKPEKGEKKPTHVLILGLARVYSHVRLQARTVRAGDRLDGPADFPPGRQAAVVPGSLGDGSFTADGR